MKNASIALITLIFHAALTLGTAIAQVPPLFTPDELKPAPAPVPVRYFESKGGSFNVTVRNGDGKSISTEKKDNGFRVTGIEEDIAQGWKKAENDSEKLHKQYEDTLDKVVEDRFFSTPARVETPVYVDRHHYHTATVVREVPVAPVVPAPVVIRPSYVYPTPRYYPYYYYRIPSGVVVNRWVSPYTRFVCTGGHTWYWNPGTSVWLHY